MNRDENIMTTDGFAKLLCSERFGSDLGRVGFKFVRDMLAGIQRTRSVNLTDVAKGLNEDIRLHATHKRLSRNLDNPELTRNLTDRLLQLGAKRVQPNTRLIVNLYELNKKYARKVEYMPGAGVNADAGFKVCEIIASDHGSQTYTPLLASVWSEEVPGFVSDVDEVRKAIERVMHATGNKGMMYFEDQRMDSDFLFRLVNASNFNFTILLRDWDAEVIYRNEPRRIQTLIDGAETPYGRTMFKLIPEGALPGKKTIDMDIFFHAGALAIKLPNSSRNFRLIALKSKNRLVGETTSPLLTTETNLRSRKALMGLVESFLSVHDVLQAHQSLRDSFDPSSFRVLTYNRLQLLMTLLQAVMHYEVALARTVAVSGRQYMHNPHDGDVERAYYHPQHRPIPQGNPQQASTDAQ